MFAFCTYCSGHKSKATGEIAAIRRYQSNRITRVHIAAQAIGVHFLILSAEFGLLTPEQQIPWYDHLLLPDEVDALSEQASRQLGQYGIAGMNYFTVPLEAEPPIKPYHDVITSACNRARIPLLVMEVPFE